MRSIVKIHKEISMLSMLVHVPNEQNSNLCVGSVSGKFWQFFRESDKYIDNLFLISSRAC